VVFVLDKFISYLLNAKIIVFTDYTSLKFLLKKADAKSRLIKWMLLLQEFDIEIRDRSGAQNLVAEHLSQIQSQVVAPSSIRDDFPDEQLLQLQGKSPIPWYTNLVNFLVASTFPDYFTRAQSLKLKSDSKHYVWDDPYLWKFYSDHVIRRCVPDHDFSSILAFCHAYASGGHFGKRTTRKVLDSGFYWPTLFHDVYVYCKSC